MRVEHDMRRVGDPLAALAAYGLAGSVLEPPPGPLTSYQWFGLLRACRDHGLVSLLAAAVHRGDVAVSPAQGEELAGVEREVAAQALLAEQSALQVSAVLDGAGIGHRILGGSPRSRLGYRDPAARTFASVTVLVAPDGLGVARSLGRGPQRRRIVVRSTLDLGDVHLELSQLDDPGALLVLAGRPVPTATVEEHLVLACLELEGLVPDVTSVEVGEGLDGWEAFTGDPDDARLVAQRDVAELVLSPAVDPDRVRQVAHGWKVLDHTARAIAHAWTELALADRTQLSVWAEREVLHRGRRPARAARTWGRSAR